MTTTAVWSMSCSLVIDRATKLVLTEKGAKLYKTAIPLFEKSLAEIFATLPRPEQKELSSLLRKLNQEAPAS